MSAPTVIPPPPAIWAQRSDIIYLTFNIETKDADFSFTEESMNFKATGLPENKKYEVNINFYGKIVPDKVISKNIGRCYEFVISKADTLSPYWPSLTTDKKKPHWLKVDFNKWKDDGEGDDEEGGEGMGDMMGGMNNFNDLLGNMGGLGNPEGKQSFDFGNEEDSDDEELPKLE